jgi:hypothetical protein
MRSMFLMIGAMILIASTGCNSPTSPSGSASSGPGGTGGDVLVLETYEIILLPEESKDVKVKTGKADKAEGPAADTGVTAKLSDGKVTVSAAKDAKEGTHTVKVSGAKKEVDLKVKVGKKDKDAKP